MELNNSNNQRQHDENFGSFLEVGKECFEQFQNVSFETVMEVIGVISKVVSMNRIDFELKRLKYYSHVFVVYSKIKKMSVEERIKKNSSTYPKKVPLKRGESRENICFEIDGFKICFEILEGKVVGLNIEDVLTKEVIPKELYTETPSSALIQPCFQYEKLEKKSQDPIQVNPFEDDARISFCLKYEQCNINKDKIPH